MALEYGIFDLGDRTATADYSSATNQFRFVTSTSNTTFKRAASAGVPVLGVLQDTPASGEHGSIRVYGLSKVRVGTTSHAAIAIMDKIRTSSVGFAMPSTLGTRYVIGRALETLSSNSTGVISMLITHEGGGSSGNAQAA